MQIYGNITPLIPKQFPFTFQENNATLVDFVTAYYQWLEQPNNVNYYIRNYYNIKDLDNTFEQFIVYFKEKYLKNLNFTTVANIQQVIKHAVDIYRSKGTQRCATLLFQIAYGEEPAFYYPSTNLFYTSDGQFVKPQYLELALNWGLNTQIQQKEIQGVSSGAIAFVDRVIRRMTNNRLEDVAYISAVQGAFQAGEIVTPTDGSLLINNSPIILGSLVGIMFPLNGSGIDYTVGTNIELSSLNGEAAVMRVANTEIGSGFIELEFGSGGFGYSTNIINETINYTAGSSGTSTFANGTNIYSYYPNNVVQGIGLIQGISNTVTNTGVLSVLVLSGGFNSTIFSYGNTTNATVGSSSNTVVLPNILVSNESLSLSNVVLNTSNLEYVHYFGFMDAITQSMATINYISANGTLLTGMNVYQWSGGSIIGNGVIMDVNASNGTSGTLVVQLVANTLGNANYTNSTQQFFTSANAIVANIASNGYSNTSASGNIIANNDVVILTVNNISGSFASGEEIFQEGPLTFQTVDQKIRGYGTLTSILSNQLTVSNVVGCFDANVGGIAEITGSTFGATANIISIATTCGIINVSSNPFVASPYSLLVTPLTTSSLIQTFPGGNGINIQITGTLAYQETVQLNTDSLATMASVVMSSATYGANIFPAFPSANANTVMQTALNFLTCNIGQISNISLTGVTSGFTTQPFVVIDEPLVSKQYIYDDIIYIAASNTPFTIGEVVTQAATGAQGNLLSISNNLFLEVRRLFYANDFIPTTNSTTTIVGTSSNATANIIGVDYDYMSPVMGRNALIASQIISGIGILSNGQIVDSGYGFVNGETIIVGSNGAVGMAVIGGMGTGSGYYLSLGSAPSGFNKLFDGYFYQHYSYQIISSQMIANYQNMIQELTHVAGTIMFGAYVHNSDFNNSIHAQSTIIQNVLHPTWDLYPFTAI